MRAKILTIINYFKIKNQQKKLAEEVHELNEAITEYEITKTLLWDTKIDKLQNEQKRHIIEEIADCHVLLKQIQEYYDITNKEIEHKISDKIERTLKRIESKYYEK